MPSYDALLFVSFGGPEGMDDVMPFLENVLRGRNVPAERMRAVAAHYEHFGGKSPINAQNRALIAALREELDAEGLSLPIHWGNRNWRPYLDEAMREMADAGVTRALAFVTSAFSSYSGCRQYLEDIERARTAVGERAPRVDKLRVFHNHPGFIGAMADRVRAAFEEVPAALRPEAHLAFTAHSIPLAMAEGCAFVAQLEEACRLVAERAGRSSWRLVYQSRSGAPHQPWLGPDILEHLQALRAEGATDVVVAPIGFISDHLEVKYDLDYEARRKAEEIGLRLVRAATVGTHPAFVRMIRELVEERLGETAERPALGAFGPAPDNCPEGCCPVGASRPAPVRS
jgi:protoporphyrin/coproporphyrin ferrochelatase